MRLFNIISIAFILLLLISCKDKIESKVGFQEKPKQEVENESGEKFEKLDVSELNMKLVKSEEQFTPEAIMKMYYPHEVEGAEGNEQISIHRKQISKTEVEMILTHENMLDDSMNGEKYVLRLKKVGDRWVAASLKKNWKCWEGRGQNSWGISNCN